MARYYLSPFVGTGEVLDPYRPPFTPPDLEGVDFNMVDLRGGSATGWCVVATATPVPNPAALGMVELGDDPTVRLSGRSRNAIEGRLSLSLDTVSSLGAVLGELLINHARLDGLRWKPLRFNRRRVPDPDDGRLTARYRGIYLGAPGERIFDQIVRDGPGTTITESFNTDDSDTLGPDLTWTEVLGDFDIASNKAVSTVHSNARAESALSTDDHYAEADITQNDSGLDAGLIVRFEAAAETFYAGLERNGNLSIILRRDAGSNTILNTGSGNSWDGTETRARFEIDGSDMEWFFPSDTSSLTQTDTDLTGQVRTGLYSHYSTGMDGKWDVFEAGDLGAGAQDIAPTLVSQTIAGVDPALSIDITPSLVSQTIDAVDPALSIDITPALASQLVAAIDPTVTPGAVDISPTLASQLLTGVDPIVGPPGLTPSLVTQLIAAVEPSQLGMGINADLVSQLLAGIEPAVSLDTGQPITPTLVSQLITGVDPTVTPGAVDISPSLVSQLLAAVDPALAIDIAPSLVSQLLAAVDPALTPGAVDISPDLVSQLLAGVDPSVALAGLFFWEEDAVAYTDNKVAYDPLVPADPNPL